MSRLPYLRRDQLTAEGQALWDAIAGAIGGSQLVTEQGGLAGPFNAAVHAPDTGRALLTLARTLQTGTSIDRRLTEIAILTAVSAWSPRHNRYLA